MPKGRFGAQPRSDRSAPAQPRHLRGRACFIQKNQPMDFFAHHRLAICLPVMTRLGHRSALGLRSQKCFF